MRKDNWVVCINAANFEHPAFELVEGKMYLVYDVKAAPSLLSRTNIQLIFQADDGSLVEINAKRFKRID